MNHKLLLIAALLATAVSLVVSDHEFDFAFYKFTVKWPASVCAQPNVYCRPDVLPSFKILGLWPSYANGTVLPPYNKQTFKCHYDPLAPAEIIDDLEPIRGKLTTDWPNVTLYRSNQANEDLWKAEWRKHGMCSDYPQKPFKYFDSALHLNNNKQFNNPFDGTDIVPRAEPYTAKELGDAIKNNLGFYPEIACTKVNNELLLKEIRLCFKRDTKNPPTQLQNCPRAYAYACKQDDDEVRFPIPPSP